MNLASPPSQRIHDPRHAAAKSRRLHPRLQARGVASHVQTRDGSTAGLPVENISMGGMFVRSGSPIDPGTPVMVQLVRPGLRRAIQVTGRVVSVVSPTEARLRGAIAGMGIRFDPMDGDAEARLRGLLDVLIEAPARGAVAPAAPRAPEPAMPRAPEPVAPLPRVPDVTPAAAFDATFLELAEAKGTIDEQDGRIRQLLAEVTELRKEILRRNRTIGDLAHRLASYEAQAA